MALTTAATPTFDFSVGEVTMTISPPPGYCLPTGKDAAVAQLIAAGDTASVTHVTFKRCSGNFTLGANDYILIKTPTSMLSVNVDRPALIKELGAQFADPVAVAETSSALNRTDAGADLSRVLGTKVELKGEVKPLGHDEVCAYMGGQIEVKSAATSYLQPTGVCITSVGGKVVTIGRYGTDLTPAAIATLLRETRVIALSIRAAPAK